MDWAGPVNITHHMLMQVHKGRPQGPGLIGSPHAPDVERQVLAVNNALHTANKLQKSMPLGSIAV